VEPGGRYIFLLEGCEYSRCLPDRPHRSIGWGASNWAGAGLAIALPRGRVPGLNRCLCLPVLCGGGFFFFLSLPHRCRVSTRGRSSVLAQRGPPGRGPASQRGLLATSATSSRWLRPAGRFASLFVPVDAGYGCAIGVGGRIGAATSRYRRRRAVRVAIGCVSAAFFFPTTRPVGEIPLCSPWVRSWRRLPTFCPLEGDWRLDVSVFTELI
jgi:hypothetical protein